MAFRGCVILLFCLLSGVVYADDVSMTSTPATQEPSTSKITSITQVATSHTILTTEAQTTLDLDATAEASSTKTTTAAPSTKTTTAAPSTKTTTAAPSTKTTTAAPSTKATTAAPSTKATTAAPSTKATTAAPSTKATTAAPSTNATTAAPTTNATTAVPTTAHSNATTAPTAPPTTPPVPKPTVGNYSVMSDVNSTVCLLAKMGIQFSFTTSGNASRQTINLDPNVTKANGICGSGGKDSSLVLTSEKITLQFVFTNVSNKFHLHAFMLSVDFGDGSFFNESNTNLSLWEASVGSSYMCRKEQSFNISDKLTLNTFELQVQPFGVQKNTFSTAEECFLDSDLSFLVPIAVGVALSFLIVLVLISYLIGRRKSRTGYQSV
ncbi:lysosome-associated membrane glycoprotein 2 isoform X2 [Misgurnus anguillicaudatus]|uniref:lysosome-associated membrane glycoprotein 2 isoform X2 n=1 Tax=Misgurnus anguillicaudatus TaxID=75329 RepID=UPI003CCF1C84